MSQWNRAALAQQRGLSLKKMLQTWLRPLCDALHPKECQRGRLHEGFARSGRITTNTLTLHNRTASDAFQGCPYTWQKARAFTILFFSKKQTVTNRYSVKWQKHAISVNLLHFLTSVPLGCLFCECQGLLWPPAVEQPASHGMCLDCFLSPWPISDSTGSTGQGGSDARKAVTPMNAMQYL